MFCLNLLSCPGLLSSFLIYDTVLGFIALFMMKSMLEIFKQIKERRRLLSVILSPKCPSWLYGHLLFLGRNQASLERRVAAIKDFPALYCVFIGPLLTGVTVHHPDLAKVLLSSDAHKGFILKKGLKDTLGEGLLSSDGKKWQAKRHMLNPAFRFDTLKAYFGTFNSSVKSTLQWLEEKSELNELCDIHLPCSRLSFDNMTRCIMSQPSAENGEDVPLIQHMKELQHLMICRFQNPLLRSNWLFNLTPNGRKFKLLSSKNNAIITKIIEDRRILLSNTDGCSGINKQGISDDKLNFKGKRKMDFLDILLLSKYEDGSSLSEEEIRCEVRLFFVAGSETTGNAMTWLAYTLSQNQDWQEKCRKEIIEVCGDKIDVEWDDIGKLKNLHLCIKETLRLYPIAPNIGRTVNSPITFVDPYDTNKVVRLNKGTTVVLSIFALHRHPDFWENPDLFDPERFTPERSRGRPSFAYLPFSASSRNCIGQQFAMHEIKVSFAQILRKYKLLPVSDFSPTMVPEVTLKPKDYVYIKVKKL